MDALPTGLVTFLFTDIQGSTRLWEQYPEEMPAALVRHDAILRNAIESRGGYVFKTVGDAFCAAFNRPLDGVLAAADAQLALKDEPGPDGSGLRVRMALHAGVADERDRDYFGRPINRLSRILSTAHGGQIILSGSVQDAIWHALPPPHALLDLGSHRLQDLESPESIHQLVHADLLRDFPPLRSLQQFQHNLPCQLTTFVGRETQVQEVLGLIDRARLVTLTGSGGIGKTRLSLQVGAERITRFTDGVWIVELAALTESALVTQTVAEVLSIQEQPGQRLLDTIGAALRDKELLLLLDNCEHLIDASAQLADSLLRGCPKVRILATSREPLQIDGEFTYRVPSLDLPDPDSRTDPGIVANFAAVRLFRDRATAGVPTFEITADNVAAVAQICRRLDGIPLAIELAAARVRGINVYEIQRRLDDQFTLLSRGSRTALPRQQTLRALIEWSWNLLTEPERVVLRRVSVFSGGCPLEAAEAVCGDDDVFDLLCQLVDKSLIIADEREDGIRYRMMETIRAFGLEHLRDAGEEEAIRLRHFAWVASLAREAQPQIDAPDMQEWLDRLHLEHDNIRAALKFPPNAEERMQLANDVHRFWFIRGHLTEGREWLEGALRDAPDADPLRRAKAHNCLGILAWRQGDLARAREAFTASLEYRLASGDRSGSAACLNNLGLVADDEGDLEAGRQYYQDALAIYRELGDSQRISMVLENLGGNLLDLGDLDGAESAFEEYRKIAEKAHAPWYTASVDHNLAEIAFRKGDFATAARLSCQCLSVMLGLGDETEIMQALRLFSCIAQELGNIELGVILLAASNSLRTSKSLRVRKHEMERGEKARDGLLSALPEQEFQTLWQEGSNLSVEAAIRMAIDSQLGSRHTELSR